MHNFTLSMPTKIFFGKSQIDVLGEQIKNHSGTKVLICYGSNRIKENGLLDTIINILYENNIAYCELSGIQPNPRIRSVRKGIEICRENDVDFILAVGGGSIIDCAKTIAAGVFHDGDPWDFFTDKAKVTDALPIATVLTLAATGSEMNGNAVITNVEAVNKKALRTSMIIPAFSILDPEYTYTVPKYHTAAGTADIMSHVFEQYFSTPEDIFIQTQLAEAILKTTIKYGPVALKEPENYEARANLLFAGTLALNDLLSFGLDGDWAVHVIEHAISAISDLTHGVGLAILTPPWMRYVLDENNVEKFCNLSVNVFEIPSGNNKMEIARQGIDKLQSFFASLEIPARLSEVGIKEDQLEQIAKIAAPSDTIGSFKELNYNDVLEILKTAL